MNPHALLSGTLRYAPLLGTRPRPHPTEALDEFGIMPALPPRVSHRTSQISAAVPTWRRILAVLGAALVLLVSTAAIAPSVHELLHDGHSEHASTDRCAAVLFATGLALTSALTVSAPELEQIETSAVPFATIDLVSPRYLHQPERGPPTV